MALSETRFESIYKGLTGIARKVFEAVPIEEVWTPPQILSEMIRQRHNTDIKTVEGCLRSLVESGLIIEVRTGNFMRAKTRKKSAAEEAVELGQSAASPFHVSDVAPIVAPTLSNVIHDKGSGCPMEKLAVISDRARQIALSINQLANDIDNAAVELAEHANVNAEELKKLQQLKQLLSGLR